MTENIQGEIEDKVIDGINAEAAGRLIIFKPEKNSLGADLAVERRGKYKEKALYFKISSFISHAEDQHFIKDFPQESLRADKNFYLIFVYFDEVSQKISDYVWLIPSLFFKGAAPVIEDPNGKKFLRFESSLDIKDKNAYSKFIVSTRGLGDMMLDAFENGGEFTFKDVGFEEKRLVNLGNMKEFLCEARRNTYASDASPVDNPRLLSSKQLEFQKGEYYYRDIYFSGDNGFVGQEIVYQNSKPIWGMNYVESTIRKVDTNFLKEALLKLSEKCRLGQVCEYEKRELKYQDNGRGSLEEFSGEEQIFSQGEIIYKLNYQGRLISKEL